MSRFLLPRPKVARRLPTHTNHVCKRLNPHNKPGDVPRHSQPDWPKASTTSSASTARHQSSTGNDSAHPVSPPRRGQRANLIVRISLLERTEMREDIQRYLERWPCDLHMGRPTPQPLIARDTLCQNINLDPKKERFFRLGNLNRRRSQHIGPCLRVSTHEGLGDIGLQPIPPRRQARKSDRADLRPALRNDVANAIGLELLRERSLLLNILPFAVPKRLIHVLGTTNADDLQLG